MQKCPVCNNDRLLYHYELRVPTLCYLPVASGVKYMTACGADPRHDVNVLVYDVEVVA